MKMIKAFPRLSFAFFLVLGLVVIGSALRYIFFVVFGDDQTTSEALRYAFYVGYKLDLRLALIIVLPFLALAWIPVLNPSRSARAGIFWSGHFAAVISFIVLIYFLDLGHYDYLQQRLNFSALRFLQNPIISMQMMWQTYPIFIGAVALAVFASGLFLTLRWLLKRTHAHPVRLHFAVRTAVVLCTVVFFISGIWGKFSWYPLRWSDAYFSEQKFPSELALNPALYFVNTFATAESDAADRERLVASYDQVAAYLGVERPNAVTLDFSRHVRPTPVTRTRPNVVVVMMESFAAHLTGFYGNPLGLTPAFDKVAEEGLVFTRFYTPSVGTARGVFAMFTGIPDVSLNRTASRNPHAVQQHIILNEIDGYQKFYFLGGSANWANIRALLQHNIDDLQLYEEGDFPNSQRTDVWGISDLHLMEEANRVLRDVEEPFFAFIQLAGNHRPYTIPADNGGFVPMDIDDGVALENGFDKVDGLNSFRFMDHSLGVFVDTARQEEYFQNTLFILTADNGEFGEVPGPLHNEEVLGISYHHAPFVIFGPPLQRKGERTDRLGTQMDLMPTIAGMLGVPALNTTLGRNLLDPQEPNGYAFIHRRWGVSDDLVVVDDEFLLSKKQGASPSLYALGATDPERNLFELYPTRATSMMDLAEGFFETSKYMAFGLSQ